jgi:hypothetical protein
MGRVGRWAVLLAVAATPVAGVGCGLGKRPYVGDPLLRDGLGTWGDHLRSPERRLAVAPEPVPPRAPNPAYLPTTEWELAGGKEQAPAPTP